MALASSQSAPTRARLDGVAASARYVCDLTDAAAVIELAARVREEHGSVDGVMHLVGGWRGGQDDEDWLWLESRLVTTLRNVTLAFREELGQAVAGRFAIVSSTSVERPTWGNANYAAAKAAAETWVRALASGWAKAGTAAAVTLVVKAIGEGEGYTKASSIGDAVCALWATPTAQLNGTRIRVTD